MGACRSVGETAFSPKATFGKDLLHASQSLGWRAIPILVSLGVPALSRANWTLSALWRWHLLRTDSSEPLSQAAMEGGVRCNGMMLARETGSGCVPALV